MICHFQVHGGWKQTWLDLLWFFFPYQFLLSVSALFAPSVAIAILLSTPGLPQLFHFLIAVLIFHYSHYFVFLALSGVQASYLYFWPDNTALCSFGLFVSTIALLCPSSLAACCSSTQAIKLFSMLFCLILWCRHISETRNSLTCTSLRKDVWHLDMSSGNQGFFTLRYIQAILISFGFVALWVFFCLSIWKFSKTAFIKGKYWCIIHE